MAKFNLKEVYSKNIKINESLVDQEIKEIILNKQDIIE